MTRTLLRVLLAAGIMMALGVTLALGFDESGIDFANEDVATAHVMLGQSNEGLTVFLAADKAAGYVASMDIEDSLNDYDEDDVASGDVSKFLGNRPWSPMAFPGVVELTHAATWYKTVRLVHNQSYDTVTEAYLAKLAELGYTVTAEPISSHMVAYTLSLGDETLRMVIVRKGSDTAVTLTAL